MSSSTINVYSKYAKYLSRMVLIYFGQQGELFKVNACVFIQSTVA